MFAVDDVGLYSSTQSPGVPPLDSTSLMMRAGGAVTVTLAVPDFPATVARICAVPAETPVISPVEVTVATSAADVDHVTVPSVNAPPVWSAPAAVAVTFSPKVRLVAGTVTFTVVSTGTTAVGSSSQAAIVKSAAMAIVRQKAVAVLDGCDTSSWLR